MHNIVYRHAFLLTILSALCSCTSLQSQLAPHEGMPYYLPRTLMELVFDPTAASPLIVTPLEIADTAQRYVLSYAPDAFADERLCAARSENGLLSRVQFGSQERADDVALSVVQLLASAAGKRNPARFASKDLRLSRKTSRAFTVVVDPLDSSQIAELNAKLKRSGFSFAIDLPVARDPGSRGVFVCPPEGICFATRVKMPVLVKVGGNVVEQQVIDVVDPEHYGYIMINRAFMSTRVTKLNFSEGVLTGMRVRKDSEAAAASHYPVHAIERLLAVPGNAVALAFGTYEERRANANSRRSVQIPSSQDQAVAVDTCTAP